MLDRFDIGDSVEIVYKAPTSKGGVCTIQLGSGCDENIALSLAIKYHWPTNSVINTHTPDGWATATWISGVDYDLGVDLNVKITATDTGFDVFSNGEKAASYSTQHNLGPSTVKKASYSCDATGNPQLKSIGVKY